MTEPTETPELNIETAERVVADLRARRDQAARRLPTLTAERRTLAFDAHVTGGDARKRLDKLNREAAEVTAEIETLTAAIEEAERRLAIARAEAEAARRKRDALTARERLAEFAAAGQSLAEALTTIREATGRLFATATEIRLLAGPGAIARNEVLRVALERAMITVTAGGPMRAAVSPAQRLDPAALVANWCQGAEARLAAILGEATEPPPVDEPDPEPDEFEALAAVLGDGAEGETEEAA